MNGAGAGLPGGSGLPGEPALRDDDGWAPTTGLYVPGSRPDRFAKAEATGVDLLIVDLEDSVAPPAKEAARADVVAWLRAGGGRERAHDDASPTPPGPIVQVRVNAVGTPWHEADLAALADLPVTVEVRLPKVESLAQLDTVAAQLPGHPVTAILESALGVEQAARLAPHPAVTRLALGEADLRADLGLGRGPAAGRALEHVRVRVLLAARAAGLDAPMMSVYPEIEDLAGLRADTVEGRDLGASGRVAIHPRQLPVIAEVFAPTAEELGWAREVTEALASSGGAVARISTGAMVDTAMGRAAARILARGAARSERT